MRVLDRLARALRPPRGGVFGGLSSERDRRAPQLGTRRSYVSMYRAAGWFGGRGGRRRGPSNRGSCAAGAGAGAALNITALVPDKGSSRNAKPERSAVEVGGGVQRQWVAGSRCPAVCAMPGTGLKGQQGKPEPGFAHRAG